jgi:hypothetical protein
VLHEDAHVVIRRLDAHGRCGAGDTGSHLGRVGKRDVPSWATGSDTDTLQAHISNTFDRDVTTSTAVYSSFSNIDQTNV